MIDRRYFIYVCTLPLVVLACLTIVATPIGPQIGGGWWQDLWEHVCICLVIGTMYGITTIAAAWSVLGPGWISVRIPLSLVLVALLVIGLAVNVMVHQVPDGLTSIMGASVAAQWLALQLPLWIMASMYGLRLRHVQDPPTAGSRGQFGIRELMAFTAVVGVLLGISRLIIPQISFAFLKDREVGIFLFLVCAAMLIALPLVLAAFLARRWIVATLTCLGFIAGVTLIEWPLVSYAFQPIGGPDLGHLIGLNGFTTTWVLAFVGMARLTGYHFREATPSAVPPAAP